MRLHIVKIYILVFLAVFSAGVNTFAQQQSFDISSGGQPTISDALNGSVSGSANVTQNLVVNINFGEVSAANPNSIIKVVVPIAIRGIQAYQVSVAMTGSGNADPRAIQLTDIGYGNGNMRLLGAKGQVCTKSSHIFNSFFNNDPASGSTINSSGRVVYQSTIANITSSTVILSGPKLTQGKSLARSTDDGWVFDAVFVITPQFFAAGSTGATLTFTISSGPTAQC